MRDKLISILTRTDNHNYVCLIADLHVQSGSGLILEI